MAQAAHEIPALFHGASVEPEDARSILRPQKDPVYGFGFTLNPYRGCSHGCRYCYVRQYPAQVPGAERGTLHGIEEWGRWIAPKMNAPELLWRERHKLHDQTVFMASATDPYQPIERDLRLTRRCLEVLLRCPTTRVIVHTRSPLILQDSGLLKAFGERLSVGFSIPTDDDTVRQVTEPDAPPIPTRWSTVERLVQAGIRVGIAAAPLMPVRDVEAFARRAKASGASSAWAGRVSLLPQDPFYALLREKGWLHILESGYAEGVRKAFAAVFPRPRGRGERIEAMKREMVLLPKRDPAVQPALFDYAATR
ncbi:MAG TPA: radical SAM protein [Holophagaceae bacterium]|jgi:DNA repair photolyase|nr:radical SAM protein [Holophagaceae bacterium]